MEKLTARRYRWEVRRFYEPISMTDKYEARLLIMGDPGGYYQVTTACAVDGYMAEKMLAAGHMIEQLVYLLTRPMLQSDYQPAVMFQKNQKKYTEALATVLKQMTEKNMSSYSVTFMTALLANGYQVTHSVGPSASYSDDLDAASFSNSSVHGSIQASQLASKLPGMDTMLPSKSCPGYAEYKSDNCRLGRVGTTMGETSLRDFVIHLNDSHKWTREAIADWLDKLHDNGVVDLEFKVDIEEGSKS